MSTANERRALWFLAAVALSGSVVRLARSRSAAPADPALARQIGRVDSALERRGPPGRKGNEGRRQPTALHPDSRTPPAVLLDLNQADVAALVALPGIGPALAVRIVAARDSQGGFRALDGLCAVRGVGPALIRRVVPLVTLSGERPAPTAQCPESPRAARKLLPTKRPQSR